MFLLSIFYKYYRKNTILKIEELILQEVADYIHIVYHLLIFNLINFLKEHVGKLGGPDKNIEVDKFQCDTKQKGGKERSTTNIVKMGLVIIDREQNRLYFLIILNLLYVDGPKQN